jgi:hypothetical protein
MQRTLIIVLAMAALGACDTTSGGAEAGGGPGPGPAYTPPSRGGPESFQDSDFAWSQGQGGGSIDGVMAYRGGGGRYACQDVVLAPETPWSRARMRILYLSTSQATMPVDDVKSRTPPEHGAEYARYARHATCDGGGHFAFADIPNGAWYVITVAAPVGGGVRMAVMRRVEIDGDDVKVVLR